MSKPWNRYRGETMRRQNWNYGWSHPYFITICTKNRVHYFGEIKEGEMILSEIGKIVQLEWKRTPQIRPDMNLVLGESIVMPDHFHAIITIGRNAYNKPGTNENDLMNRKVEFDPGSASYTMPRVADLTPNRQNQFGPQRKNLASIIRGFKSAVTMQARRINPQFAWQGKYDDVIVDGTKSFTNIERYIINNPGKWKS